MKKIRLIAVLLVVALMFNIIMPAMKAYAASSYTVTFVVTGNHNIENDDGHLKIDGQYVELRNSNDNSIGEITFSDGSASITVSDGTEGELNFYAANLFTLYNTQGHVPYNNGTKINSNTVFFVEDYSDVNQNNNQGQQDNNEGENNNGNKVSQITVSAGEGTYGDNRPYDDEIDFLINGSMWNHSDSISYDSAEEDRTVTFTFETLWINRYYDNIVINGKSYNVSDYLDFDDRTEWLMANHGSQVLAFDIPNVPKADRYDIVAKHGENTGKKYLATFLWTADPEQANGEDYIGNSKLEFVKAVYTVGETTYTVTEDDLKWSLHREGNFIVAYSPDGFLTYGITADVDFDDGGLTLPGSAEVTMRVVPDYGYQVTSVNGGKDFKTTNTGVSEFTVTVGDGTAGYFRATVEKVDNTVTHTSDKVKSGNISLGDSAKTDIKNGTVRLSVDDVELSNDKITNFEEKASEAGDYKITNYLDINLDKVLYRGTADNVWKEQIHRLTDKALITLQLEEGVDASNIVIVHNIDNGDKFEIIKIESYDEKTNTITFYTDSFSNYAIASKNISKEDDKESKETGKSDETKDVETSKDTGKSDETKNAEISKDTEKSDGAKAGDNNSSKDNAETGNSGSAKNGEESGKTNTQNNVSSKTEGKEVDKSNNPKTGDNIIFIVSICSFAILCVFATIKLKRNYMLRKH